SDVCSSDLRLGHGCSLLLPTEVASAAVRREPRNAMTGQRLSSMFSEMEKRQRPSRAAAVRFGENLRAMRQRHDMTLAQVSEALDKMGYPMSINTLSKIERNERNVEIDDAVILAALFQVDLNEMLVDINPAEFSQLAGQVTS